MSKFVWWWFAFQAAMMVVSLTQTDESKLAKWHKRDKSDVVIDRAATVIVLAISLAVLFWWPR